MPIKDLSDRLRFPRLGKIRLGIKAKNKDGVEYPKAVDYFVCDNPAFQKVYPDKPKVLNICFPTENSEQFTSQFYRAYSRTRGLVCRGDGEQCTRLINAITGDTAIVDAKVKKVAWADLPCSGQDCEYYQKKACREVMFLQFMLPGVEGLGIWQLDTSSINTIININSGIELIKNVVGRIAMVPLKLAVVMLEVTPEGRKKNVPVLELQVPLKLAELSQHKMLPDPEDETPDELFPDEEQQKASQDEEGNSDETKLEEKPEKAETQPTPAPADDDDIFGENEEQAELTEEEKVRQSAFQLAIKGSGDQNPAVAKAWLDDTVQEHYMGLTWDGLKLASKKIHVKRLESMLANKKEAKGKGVN